MEFVWEALQTATTAAAAAVSAFCPVQLLPAAGEEFEVGGRRYRALKQVCASSCLSVGRSRSANIAPTTQRNRSSARAGTPLCTWHRKQVPGSPSR
jgi:hypothetical protein